MAYIIADNYLALNAGWDTDNFYVDAELQKPANADYEKVGDEIYSLREEKQKTQLENIGRDELKNGLPTWTLF